MADSKKSLNCFGQTYISRKYRNDRVLYLDHSDEKSDRGQKTTIENKSPDARVTLKSGNSRWILNPGASVTLKYDGEAWNEFSGSQNRQLKRKEYKGGNKCESSSSSQSSDEDKCCERGPRGKPGKPGKDGCDGKPGKPGKDGCNGKPGKPGHEGKKGEDGSNGNNGFNGFNGCPGRDGKDGKRGKRGKRGKPGICECQCKRKDSCDDECCEPVAVSYQATYEIGLDGNYTFMVSPPPSECGITYSTLSVTLTGGGGGGMYGQDRQFTQEPSGFVGSGGGGSGSTVSSTWSLGALANEPLILVIGRGGDGGIPPEGNTPAVLPTDGFNTELYSGFPANPANLILYAQGGKASQLTIAGKGANGGGGSASSNDFNVTVTPRGTEPGIGYYEDGFPGEPFSSNPSIAGSAGKGGGILGGLGGANIITSTEPPSFIPGGGGGGGSIISGGFGGDGGVALNSLIVDPYVITGKPGSNGGGGGGGASAFQPNPEAPIITRGMGGFGGPGRATCIWSGINACPEPVDDCCC